MGPDVAAWGPLWAVVGCGPRPHLCYCMPGGHCPTAWDVAASLFAELGLYAHPAPTARSPYTPYTRTHVLVGQHAHACKRGCRGDPAAAIEGGWVPLPGNRPSRDGMRARTTHLQPGP